MLKMTGSYVDVYAGHIKSDMYADLMASGIDSDNIYDYLDELEHITSGIDANNFQIHLDKEVRLDHQDDLNAVKVDDKNSYTLVIVEYSKIHFSDDDLTQQDIDGISFQIERVVIGDDCSVVLAKPQVAGEFLDLSDDIETQSFTALLVSYASGVQECNVN